MTRSNRRLPAFVALALAASISLSAERAFAQSDPAAAEALFREGRALMQKKQYAEACPKFESSQKLDPGLGTLMNLADCYEKNGQTASAWARFTEVVTEAAKVGDKARERVATKRVTKLEPTLSKLAIEVPPEVAVEGLEVRRGNVSVERAQWGIAIPVDPGKHKIEAKAPGKRPWTSEVEVTEPGATVTVKVEPLEAAPAEESSETPEPSETGPAEIPPPTKSSGNTQRTLGMVLVGVGVVGLGVGTWFGVTAKNRWDDAEERCPDKNACDAEGNELSKDAKSAADISTIAFIVGAAATAGGLVLWLGAPSTSRVDATTSARIGISAVGPGGPGGSVVGRF